MKWARLSLILTLVFPVWAADKKPAEPFPFEDFPDFDAAAGKPEGSSNDKATALPTEEPVKPNATTTAKAPPPVKAAPSEENAASPEQEVSDEATVPQAKTAPPEKLTVTAPAAPDAKLSQPTNTADFNQGQESLMSTSGDVPDDVRSLENKLQNAEAQYSEQQPTTSGGEPGDNLAPPEKFARVPLRPPMSDSNWLRWAGPMAQKDYKVHRGDSLWGVSQRLFGNPYLWPKIWHLNARITNPHVIEKGMTLSFTPGNPGSAPELAYKPEPGDLTGTTLYPLTRLDKKKTLLEIIDDTLRSQITESHPPFQYFMLDQRPETIARIPSSLERQGRTFFVEGDRFRLNLGDGVYPIVKIESFMERFVRGYRLRWTGLIKIRDKQAEIVKAFSEIEANDEIVQRRFQLSPLAVHQDIIGPEYRSETSLVRLQESASTHAGPGQMMGVLFPAVGLGPRPGALLEVQVGANRKVEALLIDRDQRFGTLWIVGGDQEVSLGDKIF